MSLNRNHDISALISDLQDPNDDVRSSAAEALGNLGPEVKDAVPALTAALQDQSWRVRYNAAEALGKIGQEAKTAIPALVALLKDSDEKVHRITAEALGEIGAEAISALIQAFEERALRRDVVYALGRIKLTNQEVIDVLTKITNDESNDLEVRWMAAVGLERNDVDMETFFVNHNLTSPYKESIQCMENREKWEDRSDTNAFNIITSQSLVENHETWENRSDTARRRVVYAFDVYTGQCVLIGYVGGEGRRHAMPVDIYEQAVKMVQSFLGKK
ncbi:HEAT repeat domain-containing protein [Microcoleus sp. F6_B4]